MDKNLALALALSLGILVGFQVLFPPKTPDPAAPAAGQAASPASGTWTSPPAPGAASPAAAEPAAYAPGAVVEVKSPLFEARFASQGGRLVGFRLSQYRESAAPGSGPYDLVRDRNGGPLALVWRNAAGTVVDDRTVSYTIETTAAEARDGQPAVLTMKGRTASGATITKTVEIRSDSYVMDLQVATEGLAATPLAVGWSRELRPGKPSSDVEGGVGYFGGKLHAFDAVSLEEPEVVDGQASWAGYAEHYFLAAFVPAQRTALKMVAEATGGSGHVALWTSEPASAVRYGLYVGPKSFDELERAGHDLVQAVDLGWFWFVAKPLLLALRMIEGALGNYGWAIVLITVAVRAAFYPVNKKQLESMKVMQRIQPEVKKIQERYADDREKLNLEMMELYRRHKFNPLAGCLPMLVQLPVFIGLYNVLMQSIELRHAPFVGWIHDLSQPDRLGTLAIPFVEPAGIPVMTLLMGASMIIQQKMTPTTADPAQQRVMMLMPVVFTVMFVNFPAGLVLYWLSNNVLSIAQQWVTDRQG